MEWKRKMDLLKHNEPKSTSKELEPEETDDLQEVDEDYATTTTTTTRLSAIKSTTANSTVTTTAQTTCQTTIKSTITATTKLKTGAIVLNESVTDSSASDDYS